MSFPRDLSVSAFICERALQEVDGILSAIRLVDVFYIERSPMVPLDRQIVNMHVVVMVRSSNLSLGKHVVRLDLLRPDGDRKPGPNPFEVRIENPKIPAPHGICITAQVGVVAKQNGTHWWIVILDGEEITRVPFTLLEHEPT